MFLERKEETVIKVYEFHPDEEKTRNDQYLSNPRWLWRVRNKEVLINMDSIRKMKIISRKKQFDKLLNILR